jgi:ADP-ribose pyrophosphatase YjhB (NUDIX family)
MSKRESAVWFSAKEYARLQRTVPLACVDVLPLRRRGGRITHIGLIHRATPHQGRRWCLVGGRLFFGETLAEGLRRHLRETLGLAVRFRLGRHPEPLLIAQYFPRMRQGHYLDPRQHSVALTFALEVSGEHIAAGEAFDFQWFPVEALPPRRQYGFGQQRVVEQLLKRLAT